MIRKVYENMKIKKFLIIGGDKITLSILPLIKKILII